MATKKNTNEEVVLNDYESVIIFTPVLSDEQLKDALAKYRNMIIENGGEMVHEENWGLTKLAYPINKKTTGFYHIYEYKANNSFVSKFELAFRRDERIMRFLSTSLDKHAVIYNQRKRNGEFNQSKKDKQQEGK
ncbi:30S ribosomal protein S6 [Bacteroidetes bacterium UKL13-3]|jgi:small subunit ribosomal protein S6|nr:30S ribosomal protein S6 [Bacteroidetes bacterium UKL13-3]HCP94202.1 30S ribosomal protein S6 [Bacteroidota bacterium]